MTDRLPGCTAKEMVAALEKAGWFVKRVHGSHHHLRHLLRGGQIVVAMHPGDVPRPIVRRILREAGLSEDEFREFL